MVGKNVSIVVLGDVGRSPRMQYHSLSFANEGYFVDIIGYDGSELLTELRCHEHVKVRTLSEPPEFRKYMPALLGYVLKALWQAFTLLFVLLLKRRSHHMLVQNVPAVPTLAVCWFYCLLASANLVIDWHNYSFSILALALGRSHTLVRMSRWFEGFFGQKASSHLCVTRAMKDDLKKRWNISATILYDRPPQQFRPASPAERHNLFVKLAAEHPVFGHRNSSGKTSFTELQVGNTVTLRSDRPGLLVSSTSWTEDEDFSLLLSALTDYEEAKELEPSTYPSLICVITGKGPLKDHYCNLMQKKMWKHVKAITPWLTPEDYPLLLGSADLGVCLHKSSSGLDLPMKVVDMFGCGLPVCALNFPCLNELVHHEENSLVFNDSRELSRQILSWFKKFPSNEVQIQRTVKFKEELAKFQKLRWHDNWKFNVFPLVGGK